MYGLQSIDKVFFLPLLLAAALEFEVSGCVARLWGIVTDTAFDYPAARSTSQRKRV